MEFTQEQKLYAQIVNKAWEDAEFKKELISNPAAAIEKLTGKKMNLPEGKTLVVRDQTDENTVYINLPATSEKVLDTELNEEQLEAVSGGAPVDGPIGDDVTTFPIPWGTTGPYNPFPPIILTTI